MGPPRRILKISSKPSVAPEGQGESLYLGISKGISAQISTNTFSANMASGILDGNDNISAMHSKKSSATVAELLTGKRVQVGSARTASASLSGVRSCGARLADVKSSDARSGVRSMRGCVHGGWCDDVRNL